MNYFSMNLLLNLAFFRREKEEGGKPDNDDEDDDAVKQGFVPIGQAVKNAEVRTAASTPTVHGQS